MMSSISPKERLLRKLNKQETDRPPVICPGGMMNAAIAEVMRNTGHTLPEAHHEASLMEQLAFDVAELTGFENFGIPFCMTVEAEALGSAVDYGTLITEPRIDAEPFQSAEAAKFLAPGAIVKSKRAGAAIQAAALLSKKHPDMPVIGSVTGPVSLAGSLVDPMTFLKELRKKPDASHRLLDYVTNQIIPYAQALADNGASAICIADPTATGEILGPKIFEEFVIPYINRIIEAVHGMGVPVIVHICGDVKTVRGDMVAFQGKAISVDAMVSLKTFKEDYPNLTAMGNLNTYMLQSGSEEKIRKGAEQLLDYKVDIIAPACGLSTSTPLAHLKAFTNRITEGA